MQYNENKVVYLFDKLLIVNFQSFKPRLSGIVRDQSTPTVAVYNFN